MKKIIAVLFVSFLIFSCGGDEPDATLGFAADTNAVDPAEASSVDVSSLLHSETAADNDPQLIRESFDLAFSTVNYFSLDDLDTDGFNITDDGKPLSVEDYGPAGQLPRENRAPTIYAAFSHPMVPLSKLGAPMHELPGFTITPPVEGTFHWYGSKTISFEPDEPLDSQQNYIVRISGQFKSLGGKSLTEPFEFSFQTEALDIAGMRPGTYDDIWTDMSNVPPTPAGYILLSFTEPVEIEHIKQFISVTAADKEFSFSIARPESEKEQLDENFISRSVQLTLTEDLPFNEDVEVSLAAGASSGPGLNGCPEKITRTFHSLLPFSFQRKSMYSHAFPRSRKGTINPVFLTLSQPINEDGAFEKITTSFGELENWEDRVEIWQNVIRINDLPVKYGESYTVTLMEGLSDIYGQSLSNDAVISIDVPDADQYAYFPGGSVYRENDYNFRMLEAQFEPRLIYEYQNIDEGRMSVSSASSLYDAKTPSGLEAFDFSDAVRNKANYEIMNLSPWLGENGLGSVQLNWNFVNPSTSRWSHDYVQNLVVQVTDIGLSLRYAYNRVIIWANSLSSGEPLDGAEVSIMIGGSSRSMLTDNNGLAVFELDDSENKLVYNSRNTSAFNKPVTVTVNGDRADFIPSGTHSPYRFGVYSRSGPYNGDDSKPVTFFFTDRGLYKPGETVTFRGIDRNLKLGSFEAFNGGYYIDVKERNYRAKPIIEIEGNATDQGGFFGEIELPQDIEPGTYELRYQREAQNRMTTITFEVANFRRLNFQVKSEVPDRVYYHGDTIGIPVDASYLAGGAMANAEYKYFWTRQSSYFHPDRQKYGDWVFGPGRYGGISNLSYKSGKLNASGRIRAEQETGDENIPGQPFLYILETKVADIDRQEVTSRASVVVHPGDFYIGAKLSSGNRGYWSRFVAEGAKQTAELILLTPEGDEVSADTDIKVELIKRSWVTSQQQGVYGRVNTQYTRVDKTIDTQTVRYEGAKTTLDFTPDEAGSYILRASALDNKGRSIVTDLSLYATGSSWIRWANSGAGDINLLVDKALYHVGETARIFVQSPVPDGDYLMTIEREGIYEEKIVSFEGAAGVLELPITEAHVPVIYVALTSQQERTSTAESYYDPDLGKPKGYFGLAAVNVSTETRELDVEIVPDKQIYKPGESVEVTLKVTENGKPAADSEMIFLAVDRGVLDLIDYHVPNPLTHFYDPDNFVYAVAGDDSRRLLLDPVTYDISELQGGDGEKLKRREDFVPLAVFEPFLKTDKKGMAKVRFELPDTLTTYRATAIALNDNRIGYSESEFLVQNPVNIRTALPRRLRYRDTAIGGVILQNIDSRAHEVTVSLHADGVTVGDARTKTVKIPASTSYELTYLLMAETAGEAELVFTIESDVINEELVQRIEIEQPLVKEAFTTIGSTESSAEEAVILPSAIAGGYGGFSIQLDSTQAPLVREPLRALLDYRISASTFLLPYGYHALPGILFPDSIQNLLPEFPHSPENTAKAYFTRAANYQYSDGGIRMSSNSIVSSPRASLQSAQLLQLAKDNGLKDIISERLNQKKLYGYLKELAGNDETALYFRTRAVSVLADAGNPQPDLIASLEKYGDELGLSGYAYLTLANEKSGSSTQAKALWQRVKNFLTIGTGSIDLEETYENAEYFDSEVEQLALILKAAVRMGESDDFVRRLAESLGRRIQAERWLSYSDYETAAVAFGEVFKNETGADTDFQSTVSIADLKVSGASFKGVSAAPANERIGFSDEKLIALEKNKPYVMRFEKEGEGQLYYTSTIQYALPTEIVQPRDEGLSVYTRIETLDGTEVAPADLKLGETYRYQAHISSNRDRTMLTLSIPVPSGSDIIDSAFVTSSSYADEGGVNSEEWIRETVHGDRHTFLAEGILNLEYDGWWMHYYRPEMLVYDNEMIYQWEYFYKGERRVSFLFKATTPGLYPTPPAQARLLLEPEVFGRTGGDLFVIQ